MIYMSNQAKQATDRIQSETNTMTIWAISVHHVKMLLLLMMMMKLKPFNYVLFVLVTDTRAEATSQLISHSNANVSVSLSVSAAPFYPIRWLMFTLPRDYSSNSNCHVITGQQTPSPRYCHSEWKRLAKAGRPKHRSKDQLSAYKYRLEGGLACLRPKWHCFYAASSFLILSTAMALLIQDGAEATLPIKS